MAAFLSEHWQQLYIAALTLVSLALLVSGRVTIDSLGILMIQHLSGGAWGACRTRPTRCSVSHR